MFSYVFSINSEQNIITQITDTANRMDINSVGTIFSREKKKKKKKNANNSNNEFISFDNDISEPSEVREYFYIPLRDQRLFEKIASPWEMQHWGWTFDDLQNFEINYEKIDRNYYQRTETLGESTTHLYHLIIRLKEEEDDNEKKKGDQRQKKKQQSPMYVELLAICDAIGFDHPNCLLGCHGCGYVYISRDVNLFTERVLMAKKNSNFNISSKDEKLIYAMLREDDKFDGGEIRRRLDDENNSRQRVQTLQNWCHEAICQTNDGISSSSSSSSGDNDDNESGDREYRKYLPKILRETNLNFKKTSIGFSAYNNKNRKLDGKLPTLEMNNDPCVLKYFRNFNPDIHSRKL